MARPSPSVFAFCKRLKLDGGKVWERGYFTRTYKPSIMPGHIKVPMATPKRHTPLLIPFWKNVNKPQGCYTDLASYPGHVFGGKSGLVSTVCACANDSGNFLRSCPNTDNTWLLCGEITKLELGFGLQCGSCVYAAICRLYLTVTSLVSRPRKLSNPSRQPTTSCQL